jgi:hypothetical protein
MPSKRKQINIRVDAEMEAMLPAIRAAIAATTGLAATNSDLFRMGVHELVKRYMADGIPKTKKADGGKPRR